MAVLCGMRTIQFSAWSARLSVHKLFISCIRRGLVSRDSIVDGDCCLRLSDVSVISRVVKIEPASDMSEKFGSGFRVQIVPEWL